MPGELTKTLIFEVALPDFYAEDLDPTDALLREMYGVDGSLVLTAEELWEAVENELGMITGGHVRVVILTGDKGGNDLHRIDGFIVGAKVVPRLPEHERKKDERLDYYEERWVEDEARRVRAANFVTTPERTRTRQGDGSLLEDRALALAAAITRIYRTKVYEERGKPESGISVEMLGAIFDANYLVQTNETCRHDFGMLGVCVRCGAEEGEVIQRIAEFQETNRG